LSPEMVKIAQARSVDYPHITYLVADVLSTDLPAAHFDCIAFIATLHHIPLDVILPKIASALRPGGVFMALDLFQAKTPADFLVGVAAVVVNPIRSYGLRFSEFILWPPGSRLGWPDYRIILKCCTLGTIYRFQPCVSFLHS
jgi:SAM-dependent methyltransferase